MGGAFEAVPRRRLAAALVLACAAVGILSARVVVHFAPLRAKLIQAPLSPLNSDTVVHVEPAGRRVPAAPFAVIARINNNASSRQRFAVAIDGVPVCERDIDSGATARLDCSWPGAWDPFAPHRFEVTSQAGPWSVTYLEVATHHGATRGYDLVVLPHASRPSSPSPVLIASAFLLMVAVVLLPQPRLGGLWKVTYRVAVSVSGLLFVLLAIAPLVSSFLVVISIGAFAKSIGVVAAPRLWAAAMWIWRHPEKRLRTALLCGGLVAVVGGTYGAVAARLLHEHYHGNYSGFLRMARARFDAHPALNARADVRASLILSNDNGYDGQYAYYATFDPFLSDFRDSPATYLQFIDAPPYRFGRIGFSLLARLLGGERWAHYPAIMVWLVLAGIVACAFSLMSFGGSAGKGVAGAALVVLIPGFWQSIQVALPEPIAAALLVGGYACLQRDRRIWAAGLFAASLLVRETGAVLVLCVVAADLVSGRRRSAVGMAVVAFAPVVIWRLYVGWILSPAFGATAFWYGTGDLGVPFGGFVDLWGRISRAEYYSGDADFARSGIAYPALLISGLALAAWLAARRPGPVVAAAVTYGLVAVSLTYGKIWDYIGNGQRGTHEMFLMLAIVTAAGTNHLPRALRIAVAAFWCATAGYVFLGAFDAEFIRGAIGRMVSNAVF